MLDTEGGRRWPRSCTWKRRGCGQRGGFAPTDRESVQRDLRRKSRTGRTCLRDHKSRQGSSGSSQSDHDARRAARRSTSGLAQSLQQECGSEEAETPEIEVRTEVSCAELTQAKKWVVSDSIGQRAGCPSSLGHSKEGSHIHSGGKTGGTEEGVPARAQAELDKTMLNASRDVAGKHRQLLTKLPCSFSQCLQLETAGGVLARHR